MKTRLVALLLLLSALAFGVDIDKLKPQGYVSDFAGVVDAAAKQDIERYLTQVERATGAEIALVTLDSLEGESIEYFANELFRKWGIGKKGKDEGLLLLLVIKDRQSRLEVGIGLEPVITDGTAGSLLREMRPALRSGDYGAAFSTAAHSLGQRIAQAKNVSIDETHAPRRRIRGNQPSEFPFPMLLILFLLFLFLMGGGRGGRGGRRGGGGGLLPGLLLGHMLGRSGYGGYGHGGFGGYDSGGGFGGFGGGDSGGGGASSNW